MNAMSDESLAEAAEGLASRSMYVFPLTPRSKRPLEGSKGFKDATIDVKRIRNWWAEDANRNIGVATGPSRLIVIDVDPRHDGEESWHRIRHRLGLDIDTLTSLTGGRGLHVWFRGGNYSAKSGANFAGPDYPGVDIRAIGGYVVAPPSIHDSGEPYRWEVATDRIATIPESLEEFIRECQNQFTPKQSVIANRAMIPVGNRDNALTKMAGKFRHIGMEDDEVFETLKLVNKTRCLEPLPERDLRRIVASVFRYAKNPLQENLIEPQVARSLVIISAFDIKVKRTEWLVPGFIPAGEVTIFEGRGGLGKSTVALDLLARASAGSQLPGTREPQPASSVLVFADEDDKSTIKARLVAAEADLNKVFIVDGVGQGENRRSFKMPVDLRLLEDAIVGYGAKIVYIDSLFNAFEKGYSQNDALDTRRVLGGLAEVAHRTGATIIATRHWGKSDKHDKDRGLGSVEITDVVRSVVAFDEDPFHGRIMKVTKHNYGKESEPMGYTFDSVTVDDDWGQSVEVAKIRWSCMADTATLSQAQFEYTPVTAPQQELLDALADTGLV